MVSGVLAVQTGVSVVEKRCGWVRDEDGDKVEPVVGAGVEVGAGIFSELGSPKTENVEK